MNKDNLFYGLGPKLTDEQRHYLEMIFSKRIVFCNSPAGTGKTTIAVAAAKYLYETGKVSGLLYTFSPVEEGEMGYRPGSQEEKEEDYLGPLKDAVVEIGEKAESINKLGGWIEARSHTFFRGKNIERMFVIIDEAQNWTKSQLKKMLTRLHDSCIVVVIGHKGQIDLPDKYKSGFAPYIEHFSNEEKAAIISLTINFRGWLASHADAID